MKIKVLSNWSASGGSTVAFCNLVNQFNSRGYDCTFYGPHTYHLNKCKGALKENFKIEKDDILIAHFIDLPYRPPVRKVILSLHEKDLYPLQQKNYKVFDKIHYLTETQKSWHNIDHPHFICPNFHTFLQKNPKKVTDIAGIIGSIDRNKQVHKSILRALEDGMEEIHIFGTINDEVYFNESVKPIIDKNRNKVFLRGFIENRQEIYDSVSDVYMSSNSENASFVADECFMTGTVFKGNSNVLEVTSIVSNEDVFKIWEREVLL